MSEPASDFLVRAAVDAEFLLDRIDEELRQLDPEDLPLITLSAEKVMSGGYRAVEGGRPRHLVLEALLFGQADRLTDAICVRGGYCEAKQRHSETLNLMKAVSDSLISAAVMLPLPIATISAYCVQSLLLDRLCKCDRS